MTWEEIDAIAQKRQLRFAGRLFRDGEELGVVLNREQLKSFATGFYEEGLEQAKEYSKDPQTTL